MQLVSPILCVGWKVFKNTKRVKPAEFDLVWERPTVDLYEDSFLSPPTTLWLEIGQLFGVKRQVRDDERVVNTLALFCTPRFASCAII